jgi:TatD DNase family protein
VLPGEALDSHCHLDLLEPPVPEVLAAARAAGITRVVTIGIDLETSRWAVECAASNDGVDAAVAIHPNGTAKVGDVPGNGSASGSVGGAAGGASDALAEITALAKLPQVRAVGETGLDYYRDWSPQPLQREWFRAHIEVAKQAGKALVIHDRDAHADVLDILAEQGPPETVVFHCFSGDEEMARTCRGAGYFMSFAGNVTFKSAGALRDAARVVPLELLLVETDAPFMTPVPHRGRPNAPSYVPHTLRCLAEVKNVDLGELCDGVTAAGRRAFGPP